MHYYMNRHENGMLCLQVSEKSRFAVPQGNAPQVLGTYCGRNTPTLISSTNDTVLVNFVSDATLAFNGFRLEWVLSGNCEQLFLIDAKMSKNVLLFFGLRMWRQNGW